MDEEGIRTGNLNECCILLLTERGPGEEGERLTCPKCVKALRLRDGAWEWGPLDTDARKPTSGLLFRGGDPYRYNRRMPRPEGWDSSGN